MIYKYIFVQRFTHILGTAYARMCRGADVKNLGGLQVAGPEADPRHDATYINHYTHVYTIIYCINNT